LNLIWEEATKIVVEDQGEHILEGSIQDIKDGVEDLQLFRAHVSFPFEMEII
jgi:hypothetical protein